MSAFMHSTAHVDAIIDGVRMYAGNVGSYIRWEEDAPDGKRCYNLAEWPTEAGRMLMRENAESMAYRYNMKDPDNDADGGTRLVEYLGYLDQADEYVFDPRKPRKTYSAGEILLALHSLEYQSCERPDYDKSAAHAFTRAAERALIEAMREYSAAKTWAIYDEQEARA